MAVTQTPANPATPMTKYRTLSLFAGIGGIDLGLETIGAQTIAYSEIDPYASQVMALRFPNATNLGDITQIDWEATKHEHGRFDIICGGFPCQDISIAGKGAGINEGTRSGLWSCYADAIRVLRPRCVLVENVAALLTRGIDRVLGDLAACGYDAEWDCIPAASVGAPHLRDRVFIIAYRPNAIQEHPNAAPVFGASELGSEPHRDHASASANADGYGCEVEPERKRDTQQGIERQPRHDAYGLRRPDKRREAAANADDAGRIQQQWPVAAQAEQLATERGRDAAPDPRGVEHEGRRDAKRRARTEAVCWPRPAGSDWWSTEPGVGRVANGVPNRVDRLRCLGNAVVPQVAEHVAHILKDRLEQTTPPRITVTKEQA